MENGMIREAEEKDIRAMMDIYNDAIRTTTATFDTEEKSYEDRVVWFEEHKGKYKIFVYEDAGQVKGYASLSRYRDRKAFDPTTEISVYIHKDYRGQHIGTALMEAILEYARGQKEIDTVVSLITSENAASIRLHETFGFAYCGQIRNAGVKFGKKLNLSIYEICYS